MDKQQFSNYIDCFNRSDFRVVKARIRETLQIK
jgi:hypothetical protein